VRIIGSAGSASGVASSVGSAAGLRSQ
jgi:hypothetical protein